TCAEVLDLREALDNQHPFVAENGAAIYWPENYFSPPPANSEKIAHGDTTYWLHRVGQPRRHWLELLDSVAGEYRDCYRTFSQLGTQGIARQTGLDAARAQLANQRAATEPLQWLGSDAQRIAFTALLAQHGGQVVAGGRFLHIMDKQVSKGYALRWLAKHYQQQCGGEVFSIALGDSDNDISMLRAADQPIIIRSPVHSPPQCSGLHNLYTSTLPGPAGWSESLAKILDQHNIPLAGANR
ncbi:MAG: HAD hydrolase family protein, partial [Gammaproteobacteria bacterium]|nr:HAD hydrolase family protein [Gammaproteobacteria bacterium]